MSSRILFDVNGELMVIRAAGGGYDGPTGVVARRSYRFDPVGDTWFDDLTRAMLSTIHDVRFSK